jgi:hypothetical protein
MDKKIIYYFGDSHTAGIGTTDSPKPDIWYHIPYSKYLTDLLGMEEKNFAIGGQNFIINVVKLIENLNEIEKNASIVLFQTQFLCNSILKYNEVDFNTKDIIVTNPILNNNLIYENKELGITKEDSITLVNWSHKFEERRSLYDLDIVISIFRYLKSKNISCYLLYWLPGFSIELPMNEFVLQFEKTPYALNGTNMYPMTFVEQTNGEWIDYHTVNEWNENLAKKIYKIISK